MANVPGPVPETGPCCTDAQGRPIGCGCAMLRLLWLEDWARREADQACEYACGSCEGCEEARRLRDEARAGGLLDKQEPGA